MPPCLYKRISKRCNANTLVLQKSSSVLILLAKVLVEMLKFTTYKLQKFGQSTHWDCIMI